MDVRRRGKRDEGSGRTQRVSTSAIISGKNAPRWAAPTMRRQLLRSKLAMSMEAGAATVVRSVTDQDGVEAWSRLRAGCCRRALGLMCRAQPECMCSPSATDMKPLKIAMTLGAMADASGVGLVFCSLGFHARGVGRDADLQASANPLCICVRLSGRARFTNHKTHTRDI